MSDTNKYAFVSVHVTLLKIIYKKKGKKKAPLSKLEMGIVTVYKMRN